jgi:hypothetical protein
MSGPAASAVVAADEVANCCFIIKSGPERIDDNKQTTNKEYS